MIQLYYTIFESRLVRMVHPIKMGKATDVNYTIDNYILSFNCDQKYI